jgi:LAO/AO transport system kinase
VINKADLDGADRVMRELRGMLELRHAVRAPPMDHDAHHRMVRQKAEGLPVDQPASDEWEPPILKVVAVKDDGVDALAAEIGRHQQWLERSGGRQVKEEARELSQFVLLLRERLLKAGLERLEREKGQLADVARRIAARQADPYALADEISGRAP